MLIDLSEGSRRYVCRFLVLGDEDVVVDGFIEIDVCESLLIFGL